MMATGTDTATAEQISQDNMVEEAAANAHGPMGAGDLQSGLKLLSDAASRLLAKPAGPAYEDLTEEGQMELVDLHLRVGAALYKHTRALAPLLVKCKAAARAAAAAGGGGTCWDGPHGARVITPMARWALQDPKDTASVEALRAAIGTEEFDKYFETRTTYVPKQKGLTAGGGAGIAACAKLLKRDEPTARVSWGN